MNQQAYNKIQAEKFNLILEQPWFGQLVTYLNFVEVKKIGDRCPVETAGVNIKGTLFYNPEFILNLSNDEIKAVLCHEILHLSLLHPLRCEQRNPTLFNVAADIKVNNEIMYMRDNNGVRLKLPNMAICPYGNSVEILGKKIDNISEKTTEEIYEELKDKIKNDCKNKVFDTIISPNESQGNIGNNGSNNQNNSNGISTQDKSGQSMSQQDAEDLGQQWKERVYVANSSVKDKGSIPGGVAREYSLLDNAELSWKKIIRQRLKNIYKKSHWASINKRFFPDYYFPGKRKVPGLNCVIGIDTSGSMSDKELSEAMGEIINLSLQYEKIKFYVMTCDANVDNVIEVNTQNKNKLFNIQLGGGGGTSFVPIFDKVKTMLNNNVDCVIYFTDLYGDFPSDKPKYPVYWITHTRDKSVPFGKLIFLNSNE